MIAKWLVEDVFKDLSGRLSALALLFAGTKLKVMASQLRVRA